MKRKINIILAFILFCILSCTDPKNPGIEYMPDMYRSISVETYQTSQIFNDSMSARNPVKGTIPRGFIPFEYDFNVFLICIYVCLFYIIIN